MRNMPDAVILFAAGFGTRMGSLTANRPKPLLEVSGRPLLDHALALTDAAGVPRKVVNTHYHSDQIEDHLSERSDVAVSRELPDILETGGGLRKALPLLGCNPVFTLNTDAVWTGANPLAALRAAWDPDRMDALLMLVAPENARGHSGAGDFRAGPDGRLQRGPGAIYTGAQILRTEGLHEIGQDAFSLNLLWDRMLEAGRLFGLLHDGNWCDVGRPEGIATAERMLNGQTDG
ncbi:nucleotidyltransferase family protein [Aliiruegeria sabulilitoris]|uniref:nucleotidyltransferase family protein n=1 Tax=Aliiruegeria sabulilitoris TaxID=1510458 RepID=UPI00082E4B28|nr:nucleotidyltransferase family protein [Aliiruegeria sabulilitoris]NDR57552.1 nucleotidyltransferase family protein [Pseudoruegeria sp. M32A2M]